MVLQQTEGIIIKLLETVKIADGRIITLELTEAEHAAIMGAGINFLVAQGFLSLDGRDTDERFANDEVNEELDASTEESKEVIKH